MISEDEEFDMIAMDMELDEQRLPLKQKVEMRLKDLVRLSDPHAISKDFPMQFVYEDGVHKALVVADRYEKVEAGEMVRHVTHFLDQVKHCIAQAHILEGAVPVTGQLVDYGLVYVYYQLRMDGDIRVDISECVFSERLRKPEEFAALLDRRGGWWTKEPGLPSLLDKLIETVGLAPSDVAWVASVSTLAALQQQWKVLRKAAVTARVLARDDLEQVVLHTLATHEKAQIEDFLSPIDRGQYGVDFLEIDDEFVVARVYNASHPFVRNSKFIAAQREARQLVATEGDGVPVLYFDAYAAERITLDTFNIAAFLDCTIPYTTSTAALDLQPRCIAIAVLHGLPYLVYEMTYLADNDIDIFQAVRDFNLDELQQALATQSPNQFDQESGDTLLHTAIRLLQTQPSVVLPMIELLIYHGALLNICNMNTGETPIGLVPTAYLSQLSPFLNPENRFPINCFQ